MRNGVSKRFPFDPSFWLLPWISAFLTLTPLTLRGFPYVAPVDLEPVAGDRLTQGGAAWGDYDGDGDLDLVVTGNDAVGNRRLRLYTNNAGVFAGADVVAAGNGVQLGGVSWGHWDRDGRLDFAVTGNAAAGPVIRVYLNQGGGAFAETAVGVGLDNGDAQWGDFDNDGDMDLLVSGADAAPANQLRIYLNEGNAAFNGAPIDVSPAGTGFGGGSGLAWVDLDSDGDLDVAASGQTAGGRRVRALRNNGDRTFTLMPDVDGAGLAEGDLAAGDFNNDGLIDIVVLGRQPGGGPPAGTAFLRRYLNLGDFAFAAAAMTPVANEGYVNGSLAVGDSENDGDIDVAVVGNRPSAAASTRRLYAYLNNGAGAFAENQIDAVNFGLQDGGLAWGDYDGDGKIDLAVTGIDNAGVRQMRLYRNNTATVNTPPGAPAFLVSTFTFSATDVSTATFKWDPAADAGVGFTPLGLLTYDIEVSTAPGFAPLTTLPLRAASPLRGNYHRPPLIFDGNTRHGVLLRSTSPWAANAAHPGLLTDTTYYHRVRTLDAGLRESGLSPSASLWTGVAPATSTLAGAGSLPGEVTLTWNAAGDDQTRAPLAGNFRIQYSSNAATVWSASTTPPGAYTVTAPTNTLPGTAQTYIIAAPSNDTYHFVLWSQDDVGQFSNISNMASVVVPPFTRSVTLTGTPYDFGSIPVNTSTNSAVAVAVTNDGNAAESFSLSASTATPGTPWSIGTALPATPNVVVVSGAFHATRPALGAFGAEDIVTTVNQTAGAAVYSIDGSQTGVAVGAGQTRSLWIRMDMPTASDTVVPQTVTVRVTAGP